jgi:hypothetical protein
VHAEECIVDTRESETCEEKCIVDTRESESETSEKSEKSESEEEKEEGELQEEKEAESDKFSLDEVEDELDEIQQQMKPRCIMCRRLEMQFEKHEEATVKDIKLRHATVKDAIKLVNTLRGYHGMKPKTYRFHTVGWYTRRGTTPALRGHILSELICLEQQILADTPQFKLTDAATQTEEMLIESEENDSESESEKNESESEKNEFYQHIHNVLRYWLDENCRCASVKDGGLDEQEHFESVVALLRTEGLFDEDYREYLIGVARDKIESEEEKVEEGEESDGSESENTMNKVQTAVLAIQGMEAHEVNEVLDAIYIQKDIARQIHRVATRRRDQSST